jgi:hypothetical protein
MAFEPVQKQHHMQAIKLKPALGGVGHSKIAIKNRISGLGHRRRIKASPLFNCWVWAKPPLEKHVRLTSAAGLIEMQPLN